MTTVNEEETMLVESVEDQGQRFMMMSSCQRGRGLEVADVERDGVRPPTNSRNVEV